MTKLALIPPFDGLSFTRGTGDRYHLMLPQLLYNSAYSKEYQTLCKTDFVMLDNGAAENHLVADDVLVRIVEDFHPAELILPDIMGNMLGTLDKINDFVKHYGKSLDVNFMVVAQGKSMVEVHRMLEVAVKHDGVTTIGIPRHMIRTLHSNFARIELAKWIHKQDSDLNIHFLGAAPGFPYELYHVRETVPFVRGMDTSMPFNFALLEHAMKDYEIRVFVRPEDYFEAKFNEVQWSFATHNVTVMKEWAHHAS
jgi:hypothetical protein